MNNNSAFENEIMEFACESDGVRLDLYVSQMCELTRSNASKLVEKGNVSVNGKTVTKKSFPTKTGQSISVVLPPVEICSAIPQQMDLDIIYEDDDIIIVNKPQGMVVHPAPGNPDKTLVNGLMYHCEGRLSGINGVIRPGIVHRIDKDTSGLLVVAKNDNAHNNLAAQIKEHSFKRVYKAVIIGSFNETEGRIDLPIGRHHTNRKKMTVTSQNSKEAATNYKTIEVFRGYSLCEFRLETGRTHQIRVHTSHFGHAVVGDPLYAPLEGKNPFNLTGQCLHAEVLGIVHPTSGEYMEFKAPIPSHFERTLELLRKNYN
ncbi:MAG: RluA family pseudouridine synthase [Clostridia bacterium]|nr:RluA family pseudouridine synthase [Clostridia bacterium]